MKVAHLLFSRDMEVVKLQTFQNLVVDESEVIHQSSALAHAYYAGQNGLFFHGFAMFVGHCLES